MWATSDLQVSWMDWFLWIENIGRSGDGAWLQNQVDWLERIFQSSRYSLEICDHRLWQNWKSREYMYPDELDMSTFVEEQDAGIWHTPLMKQMVWQCEYATCNLGLRAWSLDNIPTNIFGWWHYSKYQMDGGYKNQSRISHCKGRMYWEIWSCWEQFEPSAIL